MSTIHSKQVGYFATLGGVAVGAFIVLATWTGRPVEVTGSSHGAASAYLLPASQAGGSDASVPSASSVFSAPSYRTEEHVEAF